MQEVLDVPLLLLCFLWPIIIIFVVSVCVCVCVCICVSVCFPVATFGLGAKCVSLPGDYDWLLIKDIKLYLVTLNLRFLLIVAIPLTYLVFHDLIEFYKKIFVESPQFWFISLSDYFLIILWNGKLQRWSGILHV